MPVSFVFGISAALLATRRIRSGSIDSSSTSRCLVVPSRLLVVACILRCLRLALEGQDDRPVGGGLRPIIVDMELNVLGAFVGASLHGQFQADIATTFISAVISAGISGGIDVGSIVGRSRTRVVHSFVVAVTSRLVPFTAMTRADVIEEVDDVEVNIARRGMVFVDQVWLVIVWLIVSRFSPPSDNRLIDRTARFGFLVPLRCVIVVTLWRRRSGRARERRRWAGGRECWLLGRS